MLDQCIYFHTFRMHNPNDERFDHSSKESGRRTAETLAIRKLVSRLSFDTDTYCLNQIACHSENSGINHHNPSQYNELPAYEILISCSGGMERRRRPFHYRYCFGEIYFFYEMPALALMMEIGD